MPYFPLLVGIDLTELEAKMRTLAAAEIMALREKRAKDMRLLDIMQDGCPIINADGVQVVWSAATRLQVQNELNDTNTKIAELEAF